MSGTIIDKLIVSLTMHADGYIKTAGTIHETNKKLQDSSTKTATVLESQGKKLAGFWTAQKLEALGLIAVLAAGAKALEQFTVKTAGAVAATGRFAETSNTTPERISGLRAVAKEYGSTADAANSAVNSIIGAERNYLKTGQSSTQLAVLSQMRIRYVDPKTGKLMDPVTQIEQIAERLKKMPLQAAIATGEMLGWSDTFTNALVKSPGNLAQLIQSQVTTTKANVKAAEALVTAEGQLGAATTKLDNDIMTALVPLFLPLFDALTWLEGSMDKPFHAHPPKVLHPGSLSAPNVTEYSLTPAQIAAQEKIESGGRQLDSKGNPVLSRAGAVGIMQLTQETAEETAAKHGIPWDDHAFHYDRAYNEHLGILRMQDLLKRYHGNYAYALAAYNAGVAGASGYTSTGNIGVLPKETQDYLHNIAAAESGAAPTSGAISPHVTSVLNGLRAQQAAGGNKTTIHAPITINGAGSPAATGRAVQQHLNAMASQAARGLQ